MRGFPGRRRAALGTPLAEEWGSASGCSQPGPDPKRHLGAAGGEPALSSDETSWGEREKQKQKISLLGKGLGSAPDLCAFWKQVAMMLRGAVETSSHVSERSGGGPGQRDAQVSQGETLSVEFSGMPSCPPLMRTRHEALGTCGRRETCFGALGMDCRMRGWGGLSEEPPNPDVRNGLSYHTHFLLPPQLSCLRARRRQGNFTIVTERPQEERSPPRALDPSRQLPAASQTPSPGAHRWMLQGTAVASGSRTASRSSAIPSPPDLTSPESYSPATGGVPPDCLKAALLDSCGTFPRGKKWKRQPQKKAIYYN